MEEGNGTRTMNVYLARQPIFTREKKIYAYELLFRDGIEHFFPDIDGNSATSRVLSSTFFSSDIEQITSRKRAFINFTQELISLRIPQLFPPQITTIEVLEDVHPDALFMQCCADLSSAGYQIALDDFTYRRDLLGLIRLADIIKIDFLNTDMDTIRRYVEVLSRNGCTLLAEKVETMEQFRTALDLGFTYFQGYFFSRPELMQEKEIPILKMNLLQIMAEAGNDDFRVNELRKLIERDVGISYKLLCYMNSPFFRRLNEITSIKHAILMLGERGIKSFLSVIIMSELSQDKPDELLKSSVIRAKLCESLGTLKAGGIDPSQLFTLGLFSHIDAILETPIEHVMEKLPLSHDIKAALLNREGFLGTYLRLAESYERGDWDNVISLGSALGIDTEQLPAVYFHALGWADALMDTAGH